MPYVAIENFSKGLDTRRRALSSDSGTLLKLDNCVVNRGGDVVKRKAFVSAGTLPSGTVGWVAHGAFIYIFGTVESPDIDLTINNIQYVRLQRPNNPVGVAAMLSRIISVDFEGDIPYVIAEYGDGNVFHFYNDVNNPANTTNGYISFFAASNAGAMFDLTASAGVTGYTRQVRSGNWGQGLAIRIRDNNNIFSSSVNGYVDYDLGKPASFRDRNPDESLIDYVVARFNATVLPLIVDFTLDDVNVSFGAANVIAYSDYNTSADFTINFDGIDTVDQVPFSIGRIVNGNFSTYLWSNSSSVLGWLGEPLNITIDGVNVLSRDGLGVWGDNFDDETGLLLPADTTAAASLIAQAINSQASVPNYTATSLNNTVAVLAVETGESTNGNSFTFTGDGFTTDNVSDFGGGGAGKPFGEYVKVIDGKAYVLTNDRVYYSVIGDPYDFTPSDSNNAGSESLKQNSDIGQPRGIARYFERHALIGDNAIQIWTFDTDPTNNVLNDIISNTGSISTDSIIEFGNADVFYLSHSGLRSLQPRQDYDAAFVDDVGNKIDDLLIEASRNNVSDYVNSKGILEQGDGRYLLSAGQTVYVFNYFKASSVSAWSTWNLGFVVDGWAYDGVYLTCRSGDNVYIYGGLDNNTYDDAVATVQTNYIDMRRPADFKAIKSFDLVIDGTWRCAYGIDVNDSDNLINLGVIDGVTLRKGDFSVVGSSSHITFNLVSSGSGERSISSIFVHYDVEKGES